MAVGHGQYGARSGMRTFRTLQDQSVCRKDAYLEIEGVAIVNDTWTPVTGDAYTRQDIDGIIMLSGWKCK